MTTPTAAKIAEETILLTREALPPSPGLLAALDCGSSLLKLIFVDKSVNLDCDKTTEIPLQVHIYEYENLSVALTVILEQVAFDSHNAVLKITGTGRRRCKELIENTLNVKVVFVDEFEVTCVGGQALLQFGRGELFHPPPENAVAQDFEDDRLTARRQVLQQKMTSNEREGNPLPANFLIMGSAMVFLHVDANGKMVPISLPLVGGKSFLGLAELCLGTSNYEEVMQLADNGDFRKCYSGTFNFDEAVFPFGGMVGQRASAISRDDVAAGLVSFFAHLAHSLSVHAAEISGVSKIYVSGNRSRAKCARRSIIEQWSVLHPNVLEFLFLKTGAMSALGALLTVSKDT